MGHFSVEITGLPGSLLNGNQQRKSHLELSGLLTRVSLPSLDRHSIHSKVSKRVMHLLSIKSVLLVRLQSMLIKLPRYPRERRL